MEKIDSVKAVKDLNKELNSLNRIVKEKDLIREDISPIMVVDAIQESLQSKNGIILDAKEQEELIEKVAVLHFEGKRKNEIQTLLSLSNKEYKAILMSKEYEEAKRKIVQDNKTYILAKVLKNFDNAMTTLNDLMQTADEDKVRLGAATVMIENAKELISDQEKSSVGEFINQQSQSSDVTVNLAQFIIKHREQRGLDT